MRVLAVDPGQRRIGIAISDESGSIANPLLVFKHQSRSSNAQRIVDLAVEHQALEIVVGQSLDEDGKPTFSGRQAARLAAAIRARTEIPVRLWDESDSTRRAQIAAREMRVRRKARRGHLDDLAATVILQTYLDQNAAQGRAEETEGPPKTAPPE